MALLATALVLLLAATVATSQYAFRRCNCMFRDNRANKTEQHCILDQQHPELSSCVDGTVPRISSMYYHVPPQGLFSTFRFKLRWHHARIFCDQEGGRLAVPESLDVFKKLQKESNKVISEAVWIGLNDMKTEGTWVTVDGSKPPALPWFTREPNNLKDEDCAEIGLPPRLLNDHQCWKEKAFVCERRLRKRIPPGYVWCPSAQVFYKLYKTEKVYWEARKVCEQDGGTLLSIDTIEEARCALKLYPARWHDPLTDFTDEAAEGQFVDSKGRPMAASEYRLWRHGQPDNGGRRGPENCVILVGTGYYEDVPCGDMRPFMCQLIPY